jgi:hypothetical protein
MSGLRVQTTETSAIHDIVNEDYAGSTLEVICLDQSRIFVDWRRFIFESLILHQYERCYTKKGLSKVWIKSEIALIISHFDSHDDRKSISGVTTVITRPDSRELEIRFRSRRWSLRQYSLVRAITYSNSAVDSSNTDRRRSE